MSDDERALMQQHAVYWRELLAKGQVIVFGPVSDPAGAYGMGVLAVEDAATARALVDADPVSAAGRGFVTELFPMRAVYLDGQTGAAS